LFSGLSAGSILIVMALGLFDHLRLMGVINMAHGEMLMVGAYATLLVFNGGFAACLPTSLMPYYFPLGVVAGFFAAAAVGLADRVTDRPPLYGRPLETLLATWGVSCLLIQTMRVIFGDNRGGHCSQLAGRRLGTSQWISAAMESFIIIAITVLSNHRRVVVAAPYAPGIVGSRHHAKPTHRLVVGRRYASHRWVNIRSWIWLAGAAGAALTLIGGLKPDMGQDFIIDSFLVVAAGGVGNLAGVVWAGLGSALLIK